MIARILPPAEFPRIAETGCRVDHRWAPLAERGYIVVVEEARRIVGIAFVFLTGEAVPIVDGLWIEAPFRRKITVQRKLYQGLAWALRALMGAEAPSVRSVVTGMAA